MATGTGPMEDASSDEEERQIRREIQNMERKKRKRDMRKQLKKLTEEYSCIEIEGESPKGLGYDDLKHKTSDAPEPPHLHLEPSQTATSSQGEQIIDSSSVRLALWDPRNPAQQGIVSQSEKYKYLLKNHLSLLTDCVQLRLMRPCLKQFDVINKEIQNQIELNATEGEATERLIHHIETGPCWKLHGFLRALGLTDQKYIITMLGLNPTPYIPPLPYSSPGSANKKQSNPQKPHFYKSVESDEKLQISNDLLPGLLQHCGSYNRTLLKSSLFGYKRTDPIDLIPIYISTNPECKENQSMYKPIGKMEMFLKLFQRHPPNSVSLEGPAGAGKSAFMEDYAYEWSKDLTLCEGRGPDIPCEGHLWKLVLYIPLGSIRGAFIDAIKANLRCDQDMKEHMMAEIKENGAGVLIIGDGIDELRDRTSKQSLRDYTKNSQEMVGKPKVIIAARDGLLSITRGSFDRELHIKGFSLTQGVEYMEKYFKAMHKLTEHPVLDYAQTHQEDLAWVLKNPLQVHILSELTATGFLNLEDVKSLSTVKLFRSLDHHMVARDQECRGVDGNSAAFYRTCLTCLLNNKRQITEEEVDSGSPYLSLLTKYTDRDQDYKERHRYGFPHEMIFEFFSMRGLLDYINCNPGHKKALLLYLCADPNMRNVLRLTCGFITQYEPEMFPDTVVAIIRCCLLLQTKIEPCAKNELTNELSELATRIQASFPKDILSNGLTAEHANKMDRTFDLIQDMFAENDDCLKKYGWAPTSAKQDLFFGGSLCNVILRCLDQCTHDQRSEILAKTVHHLLPCAMHDHQPGYRSYVVPVEHRFASAQTLGPDEMKISIWCPQDLVPTLNSPNQLHQLQQTDERYKELTTPITKINLRGHYEYVDLFVNSSMKELWGPLPASGWSEEEWTPGLRQLLLQYGMSQLVISVDDLAPLAGLLSACYNVITRGHQLTQGLNIWYGKVTEEGLFQFYDWAQGVGLAVHVSHLTLVLAPGRKQEEWKDVESILRQKSNKENERFTDMKYVTAPNPSSDE